MFAAGPEVTTFRLVVLTPAAAKSGDAYFRVEDVETVIAHHEDVTVRPAIAVHADSVDNLLDRVIGSDVGGLEITVVARLLCLVLACAD